VHEHPAEKPKQAAADGKKPRRKTRKARVPVGAPPGTIQADPTSPKPVLSVMRMHDGGCVEEKSVTLDRALLLREQGGIVWLSVAGLGDVDLLRRIGEAFSLHRLALEDVVHTHQRPKLEDFPEHQFVVLRMLDTTHPGETEQMCLFLGDDFVLTFEEHAGDCFDPVRARLRDPMSRLRKNGPDYLAYALVDAIVDAYFPAMESLGDRLESVEEAVVAGGAPAAVVRELHQARRELLVARRALWPLRDVMGLLMRGDSTRISAETRVYLRDVHDHVVQLLDLLENYRELGASLTELHLASASIRLNEVMKVLTLIATIFIPLTFVVGVYGMNFDHMPELHWRYGYPAVLVGMSVIVVGMLAYFRRRGWL
jgi:magnesium transporter